MRLWQTAFILVFLITASSAAFVYGEIYDSELEKHEKTVIKVTGRFSYQLVTDKANYSFFLPEGDYIISASSFKEGQLIQYAEEKASVGNTDQRIDLVLEPVNSYDWILQLVGIVAAILITFGIGIELFLYKKRIRIGPESDVQNEPKTKELDEEAEKVLKAIDTFEGRVNQKELRETLNYSDAKLSLILTELEHAGKIKKFKRGRGNIIKKL